MLFFSLVFTDGICFSPLCSIVDLYPHSFHNFRIVCTIFVYNISVELIGLLKCFYKSYQINKIHPKNSFSCKVIFGLNRFKKGNFLNFGVSPRSVQRHNKKTYFSRIHRLCSYFFTFGPSFANICTCADKSHKYLRHRDQLR